MTKPRGIKRLEKKYGPYRSAGEQLEALIKFSGLKQDVLADMVPGIHQSEISRFVSGWRMMKEHHRKSLAVPLKCFPEDLEADADKLSPNDLMLRKIVLEMAEKDKPEAILMWGVFSKK